MNTTLIIFTNFLISGIYIFLVNNYNVYDYIYIFFSLVLLFPIVAQYIITFSYYIAFHIFNQTRKFWLKNDNIKYQISNIKCWVPNLIKLLLIFRTYMTLHYNCKFHSLLQSTWFTVYYSRHGPRSTIVDTVHSTLTSTRSTVP